jgi:hypothetical protein
MAGDFATRIIDPEAFISKRLPLAQYADAISHFKRGGECKNQVIP